MNAHEDEGLLTKTAKAIGNVAGKIITGVGGGSPATKPARPARLARKHKARLPRKQKKAMKKAALRA
jgi:hypothetical protein